MEVFLTFVGNLLSGSIHIDQGAADLAYLYEGSGRDCSATFFDGNTGFFERVPEPAELSLLGVGLLGLAVARRRGCG